MMLNLEWLDIIRDLNYNSALTETGPVAQLGARINRTDEVAGSNPARSTRNWQELNKIIIWACSAAGSASQWH